MSANSVSAPEAGTTRDAIRVEWQWRGREIRLIDTAGMRRRSRIDHRLEQASVADTLDAMTTNRPYQNAMDIDYALERIQSLAGSKFDGVVVAALESAITSGKLRLSAVEVQV